MSFNPLNSVNLNCIPGKPILQKDMVERVNKCDLNKLVAKESRLNLQLKIQIEARNRDMRQPYCPSITTLIQKKVQRL